MNDESMPRPACLGPLRTTMTALPRQPSVPLLGQLWQADVAQLLDEHHMIAWSDSPARRTQFAVGLSQFLGLQRDAEVCVFYGKHIDSLDGFCHQLERSIPGPALERRFDGTAGIASLLRQRFGYDPAIGSSVMITAVTDSGGFFIFLGLATLFLL